MSVEPDEEEDRPKLSQHSGRFYNGVRKQLGENRGDMAVQKNRFILQADLVFEPFTDTITRQGRSVLLVVSRGLTKATDALPDELRGNWTFQLDVHSCASDLLEAQFASADELTEAQLTKLRKFFAEQGFLGDRVLLNAYGDGAPMDPRENERAFKKNRRIEFRLADPDEAFHADDVEPAEPADEIGWRQIDHEREKVNGSAGAPAAISPTAPAPPPREMTLEELHGSFDDVAKREGEALKAQKPVDAPEEAEVEDAHNPFPFDFVLPGLDRMPAFKSGMVVFDQVEVGPDGRPLVQVRQKSLMQHALEAAPD